MEKLKIYIDTSVISAFFDIRKPNRQIITEKWFENEISEYETFISSLVIEEIDKNSNQYLKEKMIKLINDNKIGILNVNESILKLSEIYRKEVLPGEINDTIHIATATYYNLHAIVSWNFKHIVNIKTINKIHTINIVNNYQLIEILTIENLGGSKYGNL